MIENQKSEKRKLLSYFGLFTIIFIIYYIEYFTPPRDVCWYMLTQYIVSYKFGFISRGLIGTIITYAIKFCTQYHLYIIITLSNFAMIIMAAYFAAKVFVKADEKIKNITFMMALFFCVNPGSITYLFIKENFGRLELYSIILCFAAVLILFQKNKSIYLIPIIGVISILIYQTSFLLYLPIVLILLLYLFSIEQKKRYLIVFLITGLLSGALFLYLQIWGKITTLTLSELYQALAPNTDFNPNTDYLKSEYYMELTGHFDFMQRRVAGMMPLFVTAMIVYIPVFTFIYYVYIKSFKKADKKKKFIYVIILINFLSYLPVFFVAVDYGRWIGSFVTMQFTLILSLAHLRDKYIVSTLAAIEQKFDKYKFFIYASILIYALMSRFTHYEMFNFSNQINIIGDLIKFYVNLLFK